MSNVPEAPRFGDDDANLNDLAPPRKKKSRVWLWVLGIVGGGGMLLCCGCSGAAYYMFGDITTDPAAVRQKTTQNVVDMQVPERFKPTLYMNIRLVGLQMAVFAADSNPDHGMLMLMRMPVETDKFGPEDQAKVQEQLKGQGRQIDFQEEESHTKKYSIGGKEYDFVFAKGTSNGKAMHKIQGIFPGKSGTVILIAMLPEEGYEEAEKEIDTMLNSIK